MKSNKFLILTISLQILLILPSSLVAQTICSFDHEPNHTPKIISCDLLSKNEAENRLAINMLTKIILHDFVNYSNVNAFKVSVGNVRNFQVGKERNRYHIIYNKNFVNNLKKKFNVDNILAFPPRDCCNTSLQKDDIFLRTKNKDFLFVLTGILAHEIGHVIKGHHYMPQTPYDQEKEADRFAGYILRKMGATLNEAKLAIQTVASYGKTATHPSKNDRLSEVEKGWKTYGNTDIKIDNLEVLTNYKRNNEKGILFRFKLTASNLFKIPCWVEIDLLKKKNNGTYESEDFDGELIIPDNKKFVNENMEVFISTEDYSEQDLWGAQLKIYNDWLQIPLYIGEVHPITIINH